MTVFNNILNVVEQKLPAYDLAFVSPCTGSYPVPSASFPAPKASSGLTYDPTPQVTSGKFDPSQGRPFGKIKESGAIAMSPYSVWKRTTQDMLGQRDLRRMLARRAGAWCGTVCVPGVKGVERCYTTWTEQGDLRYWSTSYNLATYDSSYIDEDAVKRAVSSTQSSSMSDFLSGYDLLTELAEVKETLAFFRSTTDGFARTFSKLTGEVGIDTWKRGRRRNARELLKSSDKALRKLGGVWMAYRYAIMPLVYSYRDIKGLVDDKGITFKTFRSKETVEPTERQVLGNSSSIWLERSVSGTVTVRSTVKAGFDVSGLHSYVMQQVAFNPLSTLWELIPLSFVLDWAVNVGDYIVANTSLDLSVKRAQCTSVQRSLTESTYLVDKTRDWDKYVFSSNPCYGVGEVTHENLRDLRVQLRASSLESYDRTLFDRSDIQLGLNSSMMTWKRWVDAFVLSLSPSRKLIRSL